MLMHQKAGISIFLDSETATCPLDTAYFGNSAFLTKVPLRIGYVLAFLLIFAPSTYAANHYVRQGASGSASGSDWTNAYTLLPASLIRGDTYYIAGGKYSGRTFNTAASGTAVITIKGATVANHGTETGWNNSYSVENTQASWTSRIVFNTSYWVFDGATHGSKIWSTTTSDYGFRFSPLGLNFSIYNLSTAISDITIANVGSIATSSETDKVFIETNDSTKSVHNVTISHCLIDGFQNAYWATSAGLTMDNWVFEYNVCINGFGDESHHGEWINNNYGYMTNQIVRYNRFVGPDSGFTGAIVANNNDISGIKIYGNVFDSYDSGQGVITGNWGKIINGEIYNNTFLNCGPPWLGNQAYTNTVAYNNLLYNSNAGVQSGVTHDYNAYYSTTYTPSEAHRQTGTGNPFVNSAAGDYTLLTATNPGITLASPYKMDMFGNIFGADGVWDRGAIEYVSGAPPSPPPPIHVPNPPVILNVN